MKRGSVLVFLGVWLFSLPMWGSPASGYWQQRFDYRMEVKLIPEDNQLIAHSFITYINQSPDTLDRVYLHLYPRAFQEGSVKYREFSHSLGRQGRAMGFMKNPKSYEWDLEITSFQVTSSDHIQSQDYSIDDTILKTLLPRPLAPGDSVTLELDWTLKVGRMFERAGEIKRQYNMAQWYPKLVVYDDEGWHPDVFHAEGEFYGEFGDFDVTLDLPTNYIVGATGIVVDGDPGWEAVAVDTSQDLDTWLDSLEFPEADSTQRRVVRFKAHQVHDFAWVASPDFLYESGEWNGIKVHVLYNKDHGSWSKVVVDRAEEALRWLSTQFGMYPWPQMTVIDRRRGGGMEYPMLVMNGRDSEGLIVHEIGHNWFYGILGNNEVDQAWLDEGFTTFQTRWHALTKYPGGNDPNRHWLKPYQKKHWRFTSYYDKDQWRAIRAITSGFDEPVQRESYLYKTGGNYSVNVYTKASLMLRELKAILGDSLFTAAMQHYYATWKLKHVNEYRFRQAIEEVAGQELDWFFDAWLHDTRTTDFELKDFSTTANPEGGWHTEVTVNQRGDRLLPPVVDLIFKDGSTQRITTDDFLWRYSYTLEADSKEKPVKAVVDPDNDFLDIDRRNNYSNGIPKEVLFRWPGMNYQPRNVRLVTWWPLLNYQDVDGWMPGLSLERKYGPWESTTLQIVYAPETGKTYFDLHGWRRPSHHHGNSWFSYHAFDFGGAEGLKLQMSRQWSRGYYQGPYITARHGFYTVNAKDTTRTDLFDLGRSTVLFSQVSVQAGSRNITLDIQAAPSGWSDWSFGRVALTTKFNTNVKSYRWKNRVFAGKIWSTDTLPVQERFGIEGNGSYDLYAHAYTRDATALYGYGDLRAHYHLEGDGNLRGFVGSGYSGTEAIVAWNSELSRDKTLLGVDLTGSLFTDLGLANGSKLSPGDEGFTYDLLGDTGVGLEVEKSYWGQQFYLRLELPFLTFTTSPSETTVDFSRWIFSFQAAF